MTRHLSLVPTPAPQQPDEPNMRPQEPVADAQEAARLARTTLRNDIANWSVRLAAIVAQGVTDGSAGFAESLALAELHIENASSIVQRWRELEDDGGPDVRNRNQRGTIMTDFSRLEADVETLKEDIATLVVNVPGSEERALNRIVPVAATLYATMMAMQGGAGIHPTNEQRDAYIMGSAATALALSSACERELEAARAGIRAGGAE